MLPFLDKSRAVRPQDLYACLGLLGLHCVPSNYTQYEIVCDENDISGDRSCFDLLKKRTDHQNHDYVLDVLDESENIDVRMEHRQSVTSFWNDLDDQEKKIAIMKYVDRFSLGEISDAVGLSLPAVNSKIQRIKAKAEMRSEGALDD